VTGNDSSEHQQQHVITDDDVAEAGGSLWTLLMTQITELIDVNNDITC